MPYVAPLIKPALRLLPKLRPPAPFPYRPPGTNRLPPTQIAPIYEPNDLLPPTGLDLKGEICIYSNAPIWELKKIRYRYPGEAWQEIAGDRYTAAIESGWNPLPLESYKINFSARNWCFDTSFGLITKWSQIVQGGFYLEASESIFGGWIDQFDGWWRTIHNLSSRAFTLWDQNGIRNLGWIGDYTHAVEFSSFACNLSQISQTGADECRLCYDPNTFSKALRARGLNVGGIAAKWGSIQIDSVIKLSDNQEILPKNECTFKVFNIFNQEILSITRDVCPEVIVVPERCYFRPENERLVARWIVGFFDPPLRIEYKGHCASVWRDYDVFSLLIFKECSDNPNCPPPRIRFDQKCEEKCEQCPPGTTIKVLLGNRIACVDAFGCVKKMIKYKPGCNSYDCICG